LSLAFVENVRKRKERGLSVLDALIGEKTSAWREIILLLPENPAHDPTLLVVIGDAD